MNFKCISFIVFVIMPLMGGCTNIPKALAITATSQPMVTLFPTTTPHLTNTPQPSPFPKVTFTFMPESTIVSGWFPIPKITHPEAMDISIAQSYKGLKVPPLPDGLVIEFYSIPPYGGELSYDPILYTLYLVRKGNSRMLWLGIPFKATERCCGQDSPTRIYDSIPLPPIDTDNLLIPFICTSNQEPDILLIVVAEPPEKGASATNIRYAWRIDQEATSLQPISTQGIECSPNW